MVSPTQNVDDVEMEVARRRLIYRACHRGTKELDFILGRYCKAHVAGFDADKLSRFELLLEHQETMLQQWLMGQVPLPDGDEGDMLAHIRAYHLDAERSQSDISHE